MLRLTRTFCNLARSKRKTGTRANLVPVSNVVIWAPYFFGRDSGGTKPLMR
jgi:hypothetical protein